MKFGPRGWVFSVYRILLTVKYLKVILGSFGCISEFWQHCISKRLVIEWNKENLGLGRVGVYRVLLTGVKVILCISNFQQTCISKIAGRRVKRSEFWALGLSIQCVQGLSTVKCLRPFWVIGWIFNNLVHVCWKWLVVKKQSETEWNLGLRGEYSVYIGYFWSY